MRDIGCKLSRLAAVMVLVFIACLGSAWAGGVPWQVGDIVVCYGNGTCNVIRIHGNAVQLLDTISDASINGLGGNNGGVALNNTLHVLATDNNGGGSSKVVVYSIASVQPFTGQQFTHTVINNPPYDASAASGDSAAAMAVSSGGHIFVGNSNQNGASIVELNAAGSPVSGSSFTFPTSGPCATTTLNSLDLSSAGDALYVTAGDGVIRKVSLVLSGGTYTLAGASCAKFADFGGLVYLYGIKDVPALALNGTCGSANCPSGESVLVVAKGFTDPDAQTGEPNEQNPNADAVNICTGHMDGTTVSCGLLLDTGGAGLTASPWVANTAYSVGTPILDPYGQVQTVAMPGTSGADEPTFSQTANTTTDDNLVIWTNQGQKLWQAIHGFGAGELVVDPAGHVQKVTTAGTSGATEPSPWTDSAAPNFGGVTKDGVKWADQGSFAWQANHNYLSPNSATDPNGIVVDANGHMQKVIAPGQSGPSAPTFTSNNPAPGETLDGLSWTNLGTPSGTLPNWQANTAYAIGSQVLDTGGNAEQAVTAGTSGSGAPAWAGVGGTTYDNAVIWMDQGTWIGNHPYTVGDTAGDTNAHLWQVTVGGTSAASAPAFTSNDLPGSGFVYENNAVIWTDQGTWQANHNYVQGAQVGDTARYLWQETNTQGTSGPNAPPFTANDVANTPLKDGLQWTDQPNPSILARYPAPAGVTTLQSLALDPLVSNCTGAAGTACSSGPLPPRMVTDSNPPVTPSFWMGDYGSGTIWRQNFAGGVPASFDAATGGSGVQGVVVYGGESANQPGLASLVVGGTLNSLDSFTASPNFLGNIIKSTLSSNSGGTPPATAISLYASAVDPISCFNDPSAGSIGCVPFSSSPAQALVLKIDIPLNGTSALPFGSSGQTLNTAITPPTGFFDNGTDVFVDEQFDDTTFVGGDPGTRTVSVHSLHEVPGVPSAQSGCQFSSPLPGGCYKLNRSTLNFTFSCPGLSLAVFDSLKPVLSLVKKDPNHVQAPQFIPLSKDNGTNGKATFRLDTTHNIYTFQLNLSGFTAGSYLGTAFDLTNQVQSFTTQPFRLDTTCK